MRTIKELQQRLDVKNDFDDRYNLSEDNKVHLLYVSPKFNATGYYRMIAPALEFNKSVTHKAIVTSIETNDFSKKFDGYVNQLDERLIAWADYIIFPFITSDIKYLLQAIQTLNPQVQLVMDLDRNYFATMQSDIPREKMTGIKLQKLQFNLGLMDLVTVPNKSFVRFLQRMLDDRLEDSSVMVHHIPSLVSRLAYEEMPPLLKNDTNKIRIGLIKPSEEELLSLKEVLVEIISSFKEVVQIVCLGIPHYSEEGDLLLKEIGVELHDTVGFSDYFQKLNELKLDFALLPAKEALYTKHQNNQLFLELSVFGIPTITSIDHSAKPLLKEGETGFLASINPEWTEALELLIKDSSLKEQLGKNALKTVWRLHGFNASQLERMTDIFI